MGSNNFRDVIDANIQPKDARNKPLIRVMTTGGTVEGILDEVGDNSITLKGSFFPGLPTSERFKNLILDKNNIIGFCYSIDISFELNR